MTTDKELLELAAKAAGIEIEPCTCSNKRWPFKIKNDFGIGHWNPLEDDGDALRLAVKLRITLEFSWAHEFPASVIANYPRIHRVGSGKQNWVSVKYVQEGLFLSRDTYDVAAANHMLIEVGIRGVDAASRRAIVRAAAEIGKAMP